MLPLAPEMHSKYAMFAMMNTARQAVLQRLAAGSRKDFLDNFFAWNEKNLTPGPSPY